MDRILRIYGPTAIFAALFTGMWTGWLPSPITANHALLIELKTSLAASVNRMTEEVNESHVRDENMFRIMQAICQNTAKDVQGMNRCNDYWKR